MDTAFSAFGQDNHSVRIPVLQASGMVRTSSEMRLIRMKHLGITTAFGLGVGCGWSVETPDH